MNKYVNKVFVVIHMTGEACWSQRYYWEMYSRCN